METLNANRFPDQSLMFLSSIILLWLLYQAVNFPSNLSSPLYNEEAFKLEGLILALEEGSIPTEEEIIET